MEVDENFADKSSEIYKEFDFGSIDIETLNADMEKLLIVTIIETERIVGVPVTKEIYGEYDLEQGLYHENLDSPELEFKGSSEELVT